MNAIKLIAVFLTMTAYGACDARLQRCIGVSGKVTYTDLPCPLGSSRQFVAVVDNSVDSKEYRDRISEDQSQANKYVSMAHPGAKITAFIRGAGDCASELEIKNLEASASSISLGKDEREFLRAEIRRAKACEIEGGNYTSSDWVRIREGQAAQSGANPVDRERARAVTENMHAPRVSEREHERMLNDQRKKSLEKVSSEAAQQTNQPIQFINCDSEVCWCIDGRRYVKPPHTGDQRLAAGHPACNPPVWGNHSRRQSQTRW